MEDLVVWIVLIVFVLGIGLMLYVTQKVLAGTVEKISTELRAGREESAKAARDLREEVTNTLNTANASMTKGLADIGNVQQKHLENVTKNLVDFKESNAKSFDEIRDNLDKRVEALQKSNEEKLEEMRKTVDEKLHDTLEKRLGESFKLVSDRLELVHKGLGEMQVLANGVGDLKRVLTNVKSRGTWAEVQLGAILEQILTPAQYQKNVQTKPGSGAFVEYAIRLPGPKGNSEMQMWLPIDSKFPQEAYLRLQAAAESGDTEAVINAEKELHRVIKESAKQINDKYLYPPETTDFAIMFLATEGLYSEALRHPTLVDDLQVSYRVVVAGPTTLSAILNSLRMGFQTLAIEQQASEVWRVLGAVKTEFGKFAEVLQKVKKQLNTATKTIEESETRTRAMERQLKKVEALPDSESRDVLELPPMPIEPYTDEESDTNHLI
jgi:DNA recombination protein RmuC